MTTKWFFGNSNLGTSFTSSPGQLFTSQRRAVPTQPGTFTFGGSIGSGLTNSAWAIWVSCDASGNTMAAHNSLNWPTTGYSYSYEVTSAGSSLTWSETTYRLSSTGAQRMTPVTRSGNSGTGIKTNTPSLTAVVNVDGSRAATDLFAVALTNVANSNMMAAESLNIAEGDADSWMQGTGFAQTTTIQLGRPGWGRYQNTFDDGADEAAWTPAGSSTAGTALEHTNFDDELALAYDAFVPSDDSFAWSRRSLRTTLNTTNTHRSFVSIATSLGVHTVMRGYVYFDKSQGPEILSVPVSTGTTYYLKMNSDGTASLRNVAGTVVSTTGALGLPDATWLMVEAQITDVSAGNVLVRFYSDFDDPNWVGQLSLSSLGTIQNNLAIGAGSSGVAGTVWWDEVAWGYGTIGHIPIDKPRPMTAVLDDGATTVNLGLPNERVNDRLLDDFNRANLASLGASWTSWATAVGGSWAIDSNQALASSGASAASAYAFYTAQALGRNQVIETTFAGGTGGADELGIIACATTVGTSLETSSELYRAWYDNGTWKLQSKSSAGSYSTFVSTSSGPALVSGDRMRLVVQRGASSDALSLYCNGQLVLSGSSSAVPYAAATYAGLVYQAGGSSETVRAENFEAWTYGGAPQTRRKVKTLGLATETDSPLVITAVQGGGDTVVPIGLATEADSAFALSRRKTKTLGLVVESDAPKRAIDTFTGGAQSGYSLNGREAEGLTWSVDYNGGISDDSLVGDGSLAFVGPGPYRTSLRMDDVSARLRWIEVSGGLLDLMLRVDGTGSTGSYLAALITDVDYSVIHKVGTTSTTLWTVALPAASGGFRELTVTALGNVVSDSLGNSYDFTALGAIRSDRGILFDEISNMTLDSIEFWSPDPITQRKVKTLGLATETDSSLGLTRAKRKTLQIASSASPPSSGSERLAPSSIISQTELSGSVTDIDDDPDSPDGNWLLASSNNVSVQAIAEMATPTLPLKDGTGLQEVRVLVMEFDPSQTGTPTVNVTVTDPDGTVIASSGSVNVTSQTQVVSVTFDAASMGASTVRVDVAGTASGGAPSVRNTINIGAIEWNTSYEVPGTGDQALPMTVKFVQAAVIGPGTETNEAFTLTRAKTRTLGIATETDASLGITRATPSLGLGSETDEAFALARVKVKTLGLATDAVPASTSDFTGSDGAAWPGDWTASTRTSGSQTIQGNKGRLAISTSSFSHSKAVLNTPHPVGSAELSLDFTLSDTSVSLAQLGIYLGADGAWEDLASIPVRTDVAGLHLRVNMSGNIIFGLRVDGINLLTSSSVASGTGALVASTLYRVRFRAVESADHYHAWAKVWDAGGAEPADWHTWKITKAFWSAFNTMVPLQDQAALVLASSGTTALHAEFDNVVVGPFSGPLPLVTVKRRELGLATEADAPQPLTRVKVVTLGLATESDSALSVTRRKVATLGIATETDAPLAITRAKTWTLGLASETDASLGVAEPGQTIVPIGLATESDSGFALARRKTKTLGQASESDTSQAITRQKVRALGQAVEVDQGVTVTRRKVRALGLATETNTPLTLTKVDPILRVLGQASSTQTPLATTRRKVRTLGLATVTGTPLALSRRKTRALGLASSTNTSLGISEPGTQFVAIGLATATHTALAPTRRKVRTLGLPSSISTAQPLSRRKVKTLGLATSTSTVLALTKRKIKALTQPSSTNSALALTKVDPILRVLGQGSETDSGLAVTRIKRRTMALPAETEFAQPLARRKTKALTQPSESDVALPLGQVTAIPIGLATSSNTGQPITRRKVKTLGLVTEADSALATSRRKTRALGLPTEADTAQVFTRRSVTALSLATEIDAGQALTDVKRRALGLTSESDSSSPLARRKVKTLGLATETDQAQVLTIFDPGLTIRNIGPAVESDTGQPINRVKRKTLGLATDASSALALTRISLRILGQPSETDLARPIDDRDTRLVGFGTEEDTAQPTNRVKRKTLGQATETGVVLGVQRVHQHTLGQLVETEQAQALSKLKQMGLGQPFELDTPITVVNASSYRDVSLRISRGRQHKMFVRVAGAKTMVVGPDGHQLNVSPEET